MKTRNYYILVVSTIIGISIVWLTLYAIIELELNPFEHSNALTMEGTGLTHNVEFSLEELKSEKYQQIIDKNYFFINSFGSEYEIVYSGVSLWSILMVEEILIDDTSNLTFKFYARDGYSSPHPLNLSIAQQNPELVILAYERDGAPLFEEGPLSSVVDRSVIPYGEFNSQYSVYSLKNVQIQKVT